MKIVNTIGAFALSAFVFSGCGGSKDSENSHDNHDSLAAAIQDTTAVTVDDTVLFKFDFVVANIPSPASLIYGIKKMSKSYDKSILNEPGKAGGLPSDFQKAVNLGIYNIDMAYAVVNNMGSDVLEYLKCVMILGDGLGLKNTIAGMVGKRAEVNLSNRDSLFAVLDDIYERSDEYLRTNKRVYIASLVFTGSWVEVLYLSTKAAEVNPAAKPEMNKLIWDQRFHLGNIIKMLEDHKGDNEYQTLVKDLKEIHKFISDVKDVKEMDEPKSKLITERIRDLRVRLSN